jgi:hypothetical protein
VDRNNHAYVGTSSRIDWRASRVTRFDNWNFSFPGANYANGATERDPLISCGHLLVEPTV